MIQIHDKSFKPYISAGEVQSKISELADNINVDYKDKAPLFVAVLNGAFMFAADLLKSIRVSCEISFVKLSSYSDMGSTGNVKQLIGLKENVSGREIIIIEDIVDSGRTISGVVKEFRALGAESVEIVTLLKKPVSRNLTEEVKYIGFEIPDRFVVGYGLDYNGFGRNFSAIYQYID
jgi:hypoxanthine phosphoribosyltransferase